MKEILLYGAIGWDVIPQDIVQQLSDANGDDVLLRIHSEGGSVLDGEAILQAIRGYQGSIDAQIDGKAFSMAAVIALEFENLSMPEDAWIMFHEVSGGGGQVKDLEQQLQMMTAMNESIAAKLSTAMGVSQEEARDQLRDEIWMNGTQAHQAGLVANLTRSQALAAHVKEGAWKNPPKELSAQVEPNQQDKQTEPMKALFSVFKKDSSDDSLQIEPVDLSAVESVQVTNLQKEIDELKATHAAEVAAKNEKLTEATASLKEQREKREELENKLAEQEESHKQALAEKAAAIEAAENSANEKATEILAQAGHPPVELTPADDKSLAEKYQAMKPGPKRAKFRKDHKKELENAFGAGALR